jgi:hypothetical protein
MNEPYLYILILFIAGYLLYSLIMRLRGKAK